MGERSFTPVSDSSTDGGGEAPLLKGGEAAPVGGLHCAWEVAVLDSVPESKRMKSNL